MAYKLIWSLAARDDLHDIAVFIARDDSDCAMSLRYELIAEMTAYKNFPELGRFASEYRNAVLREIIFWPYRIVYRVS